MSKSSSRTPRLGRGLNSLLTPPVVVSAEAQSDADQPAGGPARAEDSGLLQVPVSQLLPNPHQPRRHFDPAALQQLADSIRVAGLIQPVLAQAPDLEGGPFTIIAGERRWRAAQLAGLETVPVSLRKLDEQQNAELALIENLQREDLNAIERAHGFEFLITEFGLSHEQVAKHVGVERSTVSNALRLLDLDAAVQQLVVQSALTGGHAKALAGVTDHTMQLSLAKQVIERGLSVRQLEAKVRDISHIDQPPASAAAPTAEASIRAANSSDLEQQIGRQIGAKVHLRLGRRKGSGTLSIAFNSLDEFDALLERLGVETQ